MDSNEIEIVLYLHAKWLDGMADGKRADLTGANLADANLADANLTDANLSLANLTRAKLKRANMACANLTDSNLADSNLAFANLSLANLTNANLTNANLIFVNLTDSDLAKADLTNANLHNITASPSDLDGAIGLPPVPIIPNIDAAILKVLSIDGNKLDMRNWHGSECDTTHCRAGWTIVLAGKEGKALENKYGTELAAELIYAASRPGKPAPNWYASNREALKDIRECAKEQERVTQ